MWRPRRFALNHDLSEPSLAPRAFGPFRVLHQIGVGVLGPVYRAQGEAHDELVAIKALRLDIPPEQAAEVADGLVALREVWPAHAGLAEILAAGLEGETPWLALPHLSTPTLDTRLREARLPPAGNSDREDALGTIRGVALAIDAAHENGIVHGSLHPRDVFVGDGGLVRVTGFGIARVLARVGIRPPVRRPYSAPETLEGALVTPAADLFALGALAFELLCGRRPAGLGAEAASHLELSASADAQAHARTIVAAMLAEHPAHRPGTALAFAKALAHALPASERGTATTVAIGAGASEPSLLRADEPPSDAALRLFATQGTLWESSRPVEAWNDVADVDEHRESMDLDLVRSEALNVADPDDLEGSADLRMASAPSPLVAEPRDDSEIRTEPSHPSIGGRRSVVSAGHPSPDASSAVEHTRARRAAGRTSTLGLSAPRDPASAHSGDPHDPVAETRLTAPAEDPSHGHAAAHTERATPDASSPPAVVLALTLALGLAIGGAGGYLLGQRGAVRAGDTSRVASPEPDDGAPLADAGTLPTDEPPTVDDGPPPSRGQASSRAPATDATSEAASSAATAARRRAAATGELIVRSTPSNAGVIVNNTWRGRTPLTVPGLAFGTHTVRIVESGYTAETRRVSLDTRVPAATVAVQLTRATPVRTATTTPARPGATTGSLYIESRPSGARVLVDGRFVGTTPLLLSEVGPGARTIRLEHAGHRSWTTRVEVIAGQRQRVAASLEEEF